MPYLVLSFLSLSSPSTSDGRNGPATKPPEPWLEGQLVQAQGCRAEAEGEPERQGEPREAQGGGAEVQGEPQRQGEPVEAQGRGEKVEGGCQEQAGRCLSRISQLCRCLDASSVPCGLPFARLVYHGRVGGFRSLNSPQRGGCVWRLRCRFAEALRCSCMLPVPTAIVTVVSANLPPSRLLLLHLV